MKKYITTDKHPELKEGLIFGKWLKTSMGVHFYSDEDNRESTLHSVETVPELISLGYIKEVEEKEFTKSDMLSFAEYFGAVRDSQLNIEENVICEFNEWLKDREKDNNFPKE